jgi:hypothetical protein
MRGEVERGVRGERGGGMKQEQVRIEKVGAELGFG